MHADDASEERPTNSAWGGPSRRGLKLRQRDDYGVTLFRQALEQLGDPARLGHALLELTRAYNPLVDGPILPPAGRRRILELVAGRRDAEARRLLEEWLAEFVHRGEPDRT